MLPQPKKSILHQPYMVLNYPWCTSMFRGWYKLLVPLMNVPADLAQPMLLVFPTSCRFVHQILKTVSALLVYSVWWTIRFWDCTALPPKSMQKALLEGVMTTQNALPPDFERGVVVTRKQDPGDTRRGEGPGRALRGDW